MKNGLMNQMYQMYLRQGLCYIKKYFFLSALGFQTILGTSRFIGWFLVYFLLIFINNLIIISIWMYQMYLNEPRAPFKRFFFLPFFLSFCDEPSHMANLHRGSFGSLRIEVV